MTRTVPEGPFGTAIRGWSGTRLPSVERDLPTDNAPTRFRGWPGDLLEFPASGLTSPAVRSRLSIYWHERLLSADIQTCKDFRDLHAKAGMYAEIVALQTRLQFTLGRYEEQALELGRRGKPITINIQAFARAAREGFKALSEAEALLPPEEALLAARAAVNSAAEQLEMGVFHEMEEVGRDDLVEAAHRLAEDRKVCRWSQLNCRA